MIKLFEFVRRKSDMAPADFHAAWRAAQAEFLAGSAAARKWVVRCELNHRLVEDYAREREAAEVAGPQWDGVAVTWFEELDDCRELQRSTEFIDFSAAARERYLRPETASVLTHEATPIVDRAGGRERAELKLLCILRRNAALERAAFFRHWREHHGGLFQNVPALNEPVLAYQQNHGLDVEGATYDGVTEQWFASLPEWIDSINVPEDEQLVRPDVQYMLDPASIQFILAGRPSVVAAR